MSKASQILPILFLEVTVLKHPFFIENPLIYIFSFFPFSSTLSQNGPGRKVDNYSILHNFTEIKDHDSVSSNILPVAFRSLFFLFMVKIDFLSVLKLFVGVDLNVLVVSCPTDNRCEVETLRFVLFKGPRQYIVTSEVIVKILV